VPRHADSTLAAIKDAVDLIALVGDYLPLQRSGAKFKALCPFHDDHNPSLELNPDRQSFKCWSCGAGGDVFDFVQAYERIEFPEALRMLAERAGVALESPVAGTAAAAGPSKTDLLGVTAWAEGVFAEALAGSAEARGYAASRGLTAESVARFRLGFAPDSRDWLSLQARRAGFGAATLERAGLVGRGPDGNGPVRDRFRGRLIFPIHDLGGRPIAFGGRILPEAERRWAEANKSPAKYLNSPETPLFQKRRTLYAADLARGAARHAGWVAVVEGYTDVIAAHQSGLANVVGTLGTALGDDHVATLRRLADRVVLVFDGDEAGQKAADRSLELFLGHEVDVRVLTLPGGADPCDYLLTEGADAFRRLVDRAVDPLEFALARAASRFDFDAVDGARQASQWVLSILARVPRSQRAGLDVKVAKALDALAQRLRLPVDELARDLRRLRGRSGRPSSRTGPAAATPATPPIRLADLDPLDRELIQIVLNEPAVVAGLVARVAPGTLRSAPLRAILEAGYAIHAEGHEPTFDRLAGRLDDPALRSLAAGLLLPMDPAPLPEALRPAPWRDRLTGVLAQLAERDWRDRLRDLQGALAEVDPTARPDEHRALRSELLRLHHQRPGARR